MRSKGTLKLTNHMLKYWGIVQDPEGGQHWLSLLRSSGNQSSLNIGLSRSQISTGQWCKCIVRMLLCIFISDFSVLQKIHEAQCILIYYCK